MDFVHPCPFPFLPNTARRKCDTSETNSTSIHTYQHGLNRLGELAPSHKDGCGGPPSPFEGLLILPTSMSPLLRNLHHCLNPRSLPFPTPYRRNRDCPGDTFLTKSRCPGTVMSVHFRCSVSILLVAARSRAEETTRKQSTKNEQVEFRALKERDTESHVFFLPQGSLEAWSVFAPCLASDDEAPTRLLQRG